MVSVRKKRVLGLGDEVSFDLDKHTIFKCITGSHAYGTLTEDSDLDIRGIAIPPWEYFTGYLHKFEQYEDKVNDITIWSLRKFMELAANNNPNIIELFFLPKDLWLINTPYWEEIVRNKGLFMSTKLRHTFAGYAYAQLKRIETHRGFLLRGKMDWPKRSDFGLPKNPRLSKEQINAVLSLPGWVVIGEYRDEMRRERLYRDRKREWDQWDQWYKSRNRERAELEAKYGYDTKHASHLARLIFQGKEALATGRVTLPRPEAGLLLDIRNGKLSYEELLDLVGDFDTELEELYKSSFLPREPSREAIERLTIDITGRFLEGKDGENVRDILLRRR